MKVVYTLPIFGIAGFFSELKQIKSVSKTCKKLVNTIPACAFVAAAPVDGSHFVDFAIVIGTSIATSVFAHWIYETIKKQLRRFLKNKRGSKNKSFI